MVTSTKANLKNSNSRRFTLPVNSKVGIVYSLYHESITTKLLEGAVDTLLTQGISKEQMDLVCVPGAFELPLMLQHLARKKHYQGLIALGCLVRGDTSHFDYIATECSRGILQVSLSYHLPISMGVLTTHTMEQAWERIGGIHGHKGIECAMTLLQMMELLQERC